jgi:type IV pilus assembly protein PilC
MADYTYLAVNPKGKQVKGSIEAADSRAAINLIRDRGLTVIKVSEATVLDREVSISIRGKVGARDIAIFCRQMSSILDAGIPITTALDILSEQTEKKKLREAVEVTRDSVA